MSASGSPRLALFALALLSLIWGYNWVVMKQVIQYVDKLGLVNHSHS